MKNNFLKPIACAIVLALLAFNSTFAGANMPKGNSKSVDSIQKASSPISAYSKSTGIARTVSPPLSAARQTSAGNFAPGVFDSTIGNVAPSEATQAALSQNANRRRKFIKPNNSNALNFSRTRPVPNIGLTNKNLKRTVSAAEDRIVVQRE